MPPLRAADEAKWRSVPSFGANFRRFAQAKSQKSLRNLQSFSVNKTLRNFSETSHVAVGAISPNVGGTSLGLGGKRYGTVTAIG